MCSSISYERVLDIQLVNKKVQMKIVFSPGRISEKCTKNLFLNPRQVDTHGRNTSYQNHDNCVEWFGGS